MLKMHNPNNIIPIYSSAFINLNFSENGRHGCKYACPFCIWKKSSLCSIYMNPSNENIKDFLNISVSECIGLSGGGDPLYNFNKNKYDLNRIIDLLHEHARTVMLITRDYETLYKECDDPIIQKIDHFSISVDNCIERVKDTLKKFNKNKMQISTVINNGDKYVSIENIKKYIEFYKDDCSRILLRKDYMHSFDKNQLQKIILLISDYQKKLINCNISLVDGRNMILLINNDVYLTNDIDQNNIEDIEKYYNKK